MATWRWVNGADSIVADAEYLFDDQRSLAVSVGHSLAQHLPNGTNAPAKDYA